jgi:curli biogenesis system outer membrane secretion channel CsgG
MIISQPFRALIFLISLLIVGCVPVQPPKLPDAQATANSANSTIYTQALQDLNLLLEVYFPPNMGKQYYYVRSIGDATNLSQTGEIPRQIDDLVRSAFGELQNKIHILEHYTQDDILHMEAEQKMIGLGQIGMADVSGKVVRPTANFIVSGSISTYDRNLESSSSGGNVMGGIGGGLARSDISASASSGSGKSRIGITLRVAKSDGVSLPGRFGGDMDLWYAKSGSDFGFSIAGIGFGYNSEGMAVQGRHEALRMLADLSVVQIIGRTQSLPYWRVPADVSNYGKIFAEDSIVIRNWQNEYNFKLNFAVSGTALPEQFGSPLIAHMQAACIANGDDAIVVNDRVDDPAFQAALTRFADKYQIQERANRQYPAYPSFEMFKALELNRVLDSAWASRAWTALAERKAQPAKPAVTKNTADTGQNTDKKSQPEGSSRQPSGNFDKVFEDF